MTTLALDRFGRIVIPKDIRDRHGWKPGTELVIDDDTESVHLHAIQPVASGRGLVVRDGGLVYDAVWQRGLSGDQDPFRAVLETARADRDRVLANGSEHSVSSDQESPI